MEFGSFKPKLKLTLTFSNTHTRLTGWSTFCKNIYPKYKILMWVVHWFLLKLKTNQIQIQIQINKIQSSYSLSDSWQTLEASMVIKG